MRWTKTLSHKRRGFLGAVAVIVFFGICFLPSISSMEKPPSPELLRSIAEIGTGIFIAWVLQTALAARTSHYRDRIQELFVGATVGSAACGFGGIIAMLVLSERVKDGHWSLAGQFTFAAACSALIFVGLCIVLLAYFTYEWARLDRIEPPE